MLYLWFGSYNKTPSLALKLNILFLFLSILLNYISHPPLLLNITMWLRSSQWNLKRSDVCRFGAKTFKSAWTSSICLFTSGFWIQKMMILKDWWSHRMERTWDFESLCGGKPLANQTLDCFEKYCAKPVKSGWFVMVAGMFLSNVEVVHCFYSFSDPLVHI